MVRPLQENLHHYYSMVARSAAIPFSVACCPAVVSSARSPPLTTRTPSVACTRPCQKLFFEPTAAKLHQYMPSTLSRFGG